MDSYITHGSDYAQVRLCDSAGKCAYNRLAPMHQGKVELLFNDPAGGIDEATWGSVCLASKSSLFTEGDLLWPMLATAVAKVVCRQLGFSTASDVRWSSVWNNAAEGTGTGPVFAPLGPAGAGNLYCRGDETALAKCGVMRDGFGAAQQEKSSGKVRGYLYQVNAKADPWFVMEEWSFEQTASAWYAPSSVLLLDTFVQDRMAISNLYTKRKEYLQSLTTTHPTRKFCTGDDGCDKPQLDPGVTLFSGTLEEVKYQDEGRLLQVAEQWCNQEHVQCISLQTARLNVGDGPNETQAGLYLFGVQADFSNAAGGHRPNSMVTVFDQCVGGGKEHYTPYAGEDAEIKGTSARLNDKHQQVCTRDIGTSLGVPTWKCGSGAGNGTKGILFKVPEPTAGMPAYVPFGAEPVEIKKGVSLLRWLTTINYHTTPSSSDPPFPTVSSVDAICRGGTSCRSRYLEAHCDADGAPCDPSPQLLPFGYLEYTLYMSRGPDIWKAATNGTARPTMAAPPGAFYPPYDLPGDWTRPVGCEAKRATSAFHTVSPALDTFDWQCYLEDASGLISLDAFKAKESDMYQEERLVKIPSNPLVLKKAGLSEVIEHQRIMAWRGQVRAGNVVLVEPPALSPTEEAKLRKMAGPSELTYYDPRYSGFTLESWSCHHPNDVVLKCDDDFTVGSIPLPPNAPPPPSPAAPPPAPCADMFCRYRKFFAEHTPLQYAVWTALVNIAYYEWWHPDSAWMLEPAKRVLNFMSGLLQLTPTLADVFDKVTAKSKYV